MQLGGEQVSSAEAEGSREALKKYTLDFTERARQGKLDPVIGRDDEIGARYKFYNDAPRTTPF